MDIEWQRRDDVLATAYRDPQAATPAGGQSHGGGEMGERETCVQAAAYKA